MTVKSICILNLTDINFYTFDQIEDQTSFCFLNRNESHLHLNIVLVNREAPICLTTTKPTIITQSFIF